MNYSGFSKVDMENGEGVRVSLFVSGCPFSCEGCFNQVAKSPEAGLPFDEEMKQIVLESLNRDYVSGISLLGGDPLFHANRQEVLALCYEAKRMFPSKTVWLWTGYLYEEVKQEFPEILEVIDVMVDGRFVLSKRDKKLKWRGSSNQRVIDVPASLKTNKVVLYCE